MIKITGDDGVVFYFETEKHLSDAIKDNGRAKLDEYNLCFLALCMVALDSENGEILKCRYDMETLIDILRGG